MALAKTFLIHPKFDNVNSPICNFHLANCRVYQRTLAFGFYPPASLHASCFTLLPRVSGSRALTHHNQWKPISKRLAPLRVLKSSLSSGSLHQQQQFQAPQMRAARLVCAESIERSGRICSRLSSAKSSASWRVTKLMLICSGYYLYPSTLHALIAELLPQ